MTLRSVEDNEPSGERTADRGAAERQHTKVDNLAPRSHTISTAQVPSEIRDLVSKHAKAWARAGQSNSGACFDPYGGVYVELAREREAELLKAIAAAIHRTDEEVPK